MYPTKEEEEREGCIPQLVFPCSSSSCLEQPPQEWYLCRDASLIAQVGRVGFLVKGEENLASPAPRWVILGVLGVFFNTSFPESISFSAAY